MLYGQELGPNITPLEAGLAWTWIGPRGLCRRDALLKRLRHRQTLVAFSGRPGVPRHGAILSGRDRGGPRACMPPPRHPTGMGFVPTALRRPGTGSPSAFAAVKPAVVVRNRSFHTTVTRNRHSMEIPQAVSPSLVGARQATWPPSASPTARRAQRHRLCRLRSQRYSRAATLPSSSRSRPPPSVTWSSRARSSPLTRRSRPSPSWSTATRTARAGWCVLPSPTTASSKACGRLSSTPSSSPAQRVATDELCAAYRP